MSTGRTASPLKSLLEACFRGLECPSDIRHNSSNFSWFSVVFVLFLSFFLFFLLFFGLCVSFKVFSVKQKGSV